MTVEQLIALLSELPGDARVVTEQYACGQTHHVDISYGEVRLESDVVVIGQGIN